jgi:hypothetical protein
MRLDHARHEADHLFRLAAALAAAADAARAAAEASARHQPSYYLDTAGVAAMLSTSRKRVHQLCARRQFPSPDARDGRRPLWTAESVRRYARGEA